MQKFFVDNCISVLNGQLCRCCSHSTSPRSSYGNLHLLGRGSTSSVTTPPAAKHRRRCCASTSSIAWGKYKVSQHGWRDTEKVEGEEGKEIKGGGGGTSI